MTQARFSIYIGVSVYKDQGAIGIAVYDDTQTLSDSYSQLIDQTRTKRCHLRQLCTQAGEITRTNRAGYAAKSRTMGSKIR